MRKSLAWHLRVYFFGTTSHFLRFIQDATATQRTRHMHTQIHHTAHTSLFVQHLNFSAFHVYLRLVCLFDDLQSSFVMRVVDTRTYSNVSAYTIRRYTAHNIATLYAWLKCERAVRKVINFVGFHWCCIVYQNSR